MLFRQPNTHLITAAKLLLWAGCGWCLWWLGVGAWHSFPFVEDLSLVAKTRDEGLLQSVRTMMISYDGRYFTNLLHGLNPLAWNMPKAYPLVAVVGLASLVGSLWFLISALELGQKPTDRALAALLLVCAHFGLTPSMPHDLYVMVSSFVYMWPWTLFFLCFGAYTRYAQGGRAGWMALALVALACGIGMNEMFLPLHAIAIGSICLWKLRRQGREGLVLWLPMTLVGLCAALLFVTSPGITNRLAMDSNGTGGHHLLSLALKCVRDLASTQWRWAFGGPLFLSSSLAIAWLLRGGNGALPQSRVGWMVMVAVPPAVLYLMALAFYLPIGNLESYPFRIYTSLLYGSQLWMAGLMLMLMRWALPLMPAKMTTLAPTLASMGAASAFAMGSVWGQNN